MRGRFLRIRNSTGSAELEEVINLLNQMEQRNKLSMQDGGLQGPVWTLLIY